MIIIKKIWTANKEINKQLENELPVYLKNEKEISKHKAKLKKKYNINYIKLYYVYENTEK